MMLKSKAIEIFQENYEEYLKALKNSINCLEKIFDKAWDVKNNNGNDDIAAYYLTYAPEMLQDIGFVYDYLKDMQTETDIEIPSRKMSDLISLCAPIQNYIKKHYHPHTTVIVTDDDIKVEETVMHCLTNCGVKMEDENE